MIQSSNSLTYLNVNLANLVHNYNVISHFVSPDEVSVVIKSDAYGVGAEGIARALYGAGCRSFYVATIDEAVEIRNILNQDAKIYCLNGINRGEEYYFLEYRVIPVLNNFKQISLWGDLAEKLEIELPANIFFDTKMYRLGFDYHDAEKVKEILQSRRINIHFIMSHLSCAHLKDHEYNHLQLEKFKQLAAHFPNYKTSFCNSDGILLSEEFKQFDQVRVGINLYGYSSYSSELDLKPVVSLYSTIIQLREIKEEGYIGYSALEKVTPGMKVAILAIGFADAYFLRQAKQLQLYIAGKKCNAIGLVSMDLLAVDVTGIKDQDLYEGQVAEIYGENISIETVGEISNTIRYGLLTSLGRRVKRNYVDK